MQILIFVTRLPLMLTFIAFIHNMYRAIFSIGGASVNYSGIMLCVMWMW